MPVTTTAKRALRSSKNKETVNKLIIKKLEVAIRLAKRGKSAEKVATASSIADRAAKKGIIHKNKAARIKSQLSKFLVKTVKSSAKTSKKK